jgi:mono/diheme cytochrome c family protein
MPSFATKSSIGEGFAGGAALTDAQIADVINYVRTHFGNHYTDTITADDIEAMHPQDAQPQPKS